VLAACHEWGMTDYVYAPKDDPKHRTEWRAPYTDAELADFAELAKSGTLRLGFGISPGLSIDVDADDDRKALADKVEAVVEAGAGLVVLCFDDIPFAGGEQGAAHARIGTWLADRIADRAALALIPTEYVGIRRTPYLSSLGAGLPADVPVGWTGDAVVNDQITATQAMRRAEALGGRPPLVWDNVPVNDGLMSDRLHLGPLWGRDHKLVDDTIVTGWLANPMVQPTASLLPLASIAAWLRQEDPLDAWAAEADRRGWRVFAESCDGAVPKALVSLAVEAFTAGRLEPGSLEALRTWFGDAADVSAPGLDDECRPWLDQVRAEARVALAAIELIEAAVDVELAAEDPGTDFVDIFTLGLRWRALTRAEVSVMGPRIGFAPALGQGADGSWVVRRSSLLDGANAVDVLCRLAFDAVAWAGERG
jgi:hypothetical protein